MYMHGSANTAVQSLTNLSLWQIFAILYAFLEKWIDSYSEYSGTSLYQCSFQMYPEVATQWPHVNTDKHQGFPQCNTVGKKRRKKVCLCFICPVRLCCKTIKQIHACDTCHKNM